MRKVTRKPSRHKKLISLGLPQYDTLDGKDIVDQRMGEFNLVLGR